MTRRTSKGFCLFLMAVCDPDHPALLLLGEVLVHHFVASALVKGDIGRNLVLEGPQPVVLAADVDPGLVRPGYLATCDLLPDHLIWSLRELPHSIQHVGDGVLADVKSEDGLIQVREPFERDVLVGAEIRSHVHDVGAAGHRSVDVLREPPLAAVAARALDPHLKMVKHLGRNGKRNVHHLALGAYRRRVHIQRLSALRTHRSRIPALRSGDVPGLQPGTSLMSLLPTCLATRRFAQGLRTWDTYRILGRRNAAVRTGLDYGFHAVLKFRDAGFQLFNLSILADETTVQGKRPARHVSVSIGTRCNFAQFGEICQVL